ncbi:helix-turn-helix transcriptional regulator [Niveibacterium sp. 24ML]|uniref:helix-turn-helix transcriptional regulator n=1 Tax=Niveibacterium sp. 24ML TaxID=2985512 RepID=UPI003B633A3E
MTTTPPPQLLKKTDVCARLSISPRTLEGMVNERTFPPPVRMGRHVYWTENAVSAWVTRLFGAQENWRPQ